VIIIIIVIVVIISIAIIAADLMPLQRNENRLGQVRFNDFSVALIQGIGKRVGTSLCAQVIDGADIWIQETKDRKSRERKRAA
jgi:hypothetical protein